MKIVIPGGSGHVGRMIGREFLARGHEVVVLSRGGPEVRGGEGRGARIVAWDGRTVGEWAREIDGADVVINLAGRSVRCRYNEANRREMMDSRVESTRVVGQAIAAAVRPPAVWLQASTASIYAHRLDGPHDEATGYLDGPPGSSPPEWGFSIAIGRAWEREQDIAETPRTRRVALRSAIVMSPSRGGIFDVLLAMVRRGLGGAVAGGGQYVSWIHERDFLRALDFLIERNDIAGKVIVAAPNALPQREFMRHLRRAYGMPIGLPATRWMAAIGAFLMNAETEMILKSRWVKPARLLEAGFTFEFPNWPDAGADIVAKWRAAAVF
jgi:uncharacterized protein (TIGR01777 family)